MADHQELYCTCGTTRIAVVGAPISSVECGCQSCQTAGQAFADLPGAPHVLTSYRTTPFIMYRKDRVRFLNGAEHLHAYRLSLRASTKRVVATCCNTPLYLEFKGGHWLSLYATLWPVDARPAPKLRTMTIDLPPDIGLPQDVPNARKQNLRFFAQLFRAWVAMGFRVPKMPQADESLF